MAYRIIWSPEAVEDLESIGNYIKRDSFNNVLAILFKELTPFPILISAFYLHLFSEGN